MDDSLQATFRDLVGQAFVRGLGETGDADVQDYLTELMVAFLHTDRVYSIRDQAGRRLKTIGDMLVEGDVLLNADSFERERQVHKHVGDLVLFASGLYPGLLTPSANEYHPQGAESYRVASTFDHPPYTREARVLGKLSQGFDAYAYALRIVGERLPIASRRPRI
jgi:hypothetical protein